MTGAQLLSSITSAAAHSLTGNSCKIRYSSPNGFYFVGYNYAQVLSPFSRVIRGRSFTSGKRRERGRQGTGARGVYWILGFESVRIPSRVHEGGRWIEEAHGTDLRVRRTLRCASSWGESSSGEERIGIASRRVSRGRTGVPSAEEAAKTTEARLLQRLGQTLMDRQLLPSGQRVLVAVSGGQDSVCLIHLLVKLHSKWGWKIGVAHCDHQWSPSSRQQAAHVEQIAQGLGLDFYRALTTGPVLGEGVARTWRYGVLQRIAISHGYEAIVTAHTASDRVETLLFNIFRGSGLQGMQSLTWKRSLPAALSLSRQSAFQVKEPIDSLEDPHEGTMSISTTDVTLVRPLLDVTRTELRELWRQLELPLWPDPSNLSLDIDRNRIRHELLPYLRKHFNSGVDKSLARWAEILYGEQLYLDDLCQNVRGNAETEYRGTGTEVGRKLDLLQVRSLPIALQRRVLKQFSDRFTGKSLGFDIVERVRRACADSANARKGLKVSVPGGYYLRVLRDDLIVARAPVKELQKSVSEFRVEINSAGNRRTGEADQI